MSTKFFSFKKIFFLVLFSIIVLIASKINFSQIVGSTAQYFTFFQFFGPIAGAFLGPVVGAGSVLLAQAIDFFVSGKAIYSLFWLIPVAAKLFSKRLFLRSLGATFTAHAIGSVIWVWTIPMTPEQYAILIPITATERILFAGGISLSFIAFNSLLEFAEKKAKTGILLTEKNYLLKNLLKLSRQ